MARQILVVEGSNEVLQGLERGLDAVGGEWRVARAASTDEAIEHLEQYTFDAVVAGGFGGPADGRLLLDQVSLRQPRAVRFVLSQGGGQALLARAGGAAHQQVEPVHPEIAFSRLVRTLALGDLLSDGHLVSLVSRLRTVPSLPQLYVAIMAEMRRPMVSGRRVGQLISDDPGMTAKILQLANSPFFGFRIRVADPAHAVQLLGIDTVRALVLSFGIFSQLDEGAVRRFRLGKVWMHSLSATAFARLVASLQDGSPDLLAEAFTAALLHDIGKLVLATSLPGDYEEVVALAEGRAMPMREAEQQVLRTTHAEVGAYLLGLWGLPEAIVEAIAWHHHPAAAPSGRFGPLCAVHAANAIEHEAHPGNVIGEPSREDPEYLDRLGLGDRYAEWKAACHEAEGEGLGRSPA